ncbi:MAG: chaperone modulator CbpM [Pseudomonadales bacterium]|jgi:chaperone modulatory protein CbpM
MTETRKDLTGVVLDARTTFTLVEFCSACGVERHRVLEMVAEGVIEPVAPDADWVFHGEALIRAKRALRLVRDLGVNWPGAALALDLLEEIERLRQAAAPR